MARVPYRSRDDLSSAEQPFYDAISKARGGRMPNVFSAFLNAAEMAGLVGEVGAYARFRSRIPGDARETAILATAREMGCQYEFTHHVLMARQEGVREEVIDAIGKRTTKGMLPKESVWVDYAHQVLRKRVNDATFQAVEHLVGREVAVETTMLVGYYGMIGHVMLALGVELEDGVEPLMPED